jgi:hypothetical protein
LDIPILLHTVGEVLAKKINEQGEDSDAIKKLFNLDALPLADETEQVVDDEDMQEDGWEDMEEEMQEDDE